MAENRDEVLALYQRSYERAKAKDPLGAQQPTVSVLDLKKRFMLPFSGPPEEKKPSSDGNKSPPTGTPKKKKKKTLPAVNGLSLTFAAGETFGLLGPNGKSWIDKLCVPVTTVVIDYHTMRMRA